MKIISGLLILVTAFLSFKHGWDGFATKIKPGEPDMLADLGIQPFMLIPISILSIAIGIMVLLPQTFFLGNLLNAAVILIIMALSLKTGNIKTFLIEIPFFMMPLLMIWLGHPFKK